MYKVWLEWDLGQDNIIFTTKEKAKRWLDQVITDDDSLNKDFPEGFTDVYNHGLCDIVELTIDPED